MAYHDVRQIRTRYDLDHSWTWTPQSKTLNSNR